VRAVDPVELAASVTKSRAYFRHARWKGRRRCPRCGYRSLYHIGERHQCKRCRHKFGDFAGTYLGKLKTPRNIVAHLLYLFVLGVPAYRIRFYVPISLATIQKRVLNNSSFSDVKEMKGAVKGRIPELSVRLKSLLSASGKYVFGLRVWMSYR
jgi:transposase-like protein